MAPIHIFEWNAIDGPSTSLIMTISKLMKAHPVNLDPLYHVIDPGALDDLFAPTHHADQRLHGCVEFEYLGHPVTISASGRGYIYPQRDGHDAEQRTSRLPTSGGD